MTVENPQLNGFMQLHDMSHLINEPTCFQSHDPICIDNILTNRKSIFECFNIALKTKLNSIKCPTYNELDEAFCSVLNIHAPLKVKMLRHKNSAFVTKGLRKAIMKR